MREIDGRLIIWDFPPVFIPSVVIACNNDGLWNELGASLPLSVLPHVWETVSSSRGVKTEATGSTPGVRWVCSNRPVPAASSSCRNFPNGKKAPSPGWGWEL